MNRICRQCGAEKPLWEFVDRSKQTGERRKIHRICAACRSERSKERYQQRRKEVLSYQKQYREKLKRERIETPVSSDQKESCGSVDDGYVRLAAEILRSEFSAYRRALEKYDGSPESIGRIRSIEREILTPYYAALTMNALDLKRYCNDLRKKYGIYGGIEDWAGISVRDSLPINERSKNNED